MLWFFKREHDELHVETRFDNHTQEYVLILRDGTSERVERFQNVTIYKKRLEFLDDELTATSWRCIEPVTVLKDGWRL